MLIDSWQIQVLQGLQQKGFLQPDVVSEISLVLKDREVTNEIDMSSPADGDADLGDMPPSQTIPKVGRSSAMPRLLDKKEIEQRIEEDRERHKRLRENIWAIPPADDAEMWKIWEETSDFGEDDHIMLEEERAERERCLQMSCPHREAEASANGRHLH